MPRSLLVVAFAAILASAASAQQVLDQPLTYPASDWSRFEGQQAGDWVVHENGFGGEDRIEVRSLDPEARTIVLDQLVEGMILRQTIRCTGPDREGAAPGPVAEGDEVVTIGGREFASHWVETRPPCEFGELVEKTWYSKEVPVVGLDGDAAHGGVLRFEAAVDGERTNSSYALLSFGRAGD